MTEVFQLFSLALLGSIIALLGGVVFLLSKKFSSVLEGNSVPFASGVLLVVSLIGLLPESVDIIGERAFFVVLITFISAYLFESLFFKMHHHSGEHDHVHKSSVPLVLLGDTIHNFIDGVAIASSFIVAPGLGLLTALSTFLHEVPHEVSDFGILLKAGWKRSKVFLVNLISASVTIPGAFFVYFFVGNEQIVGILLAVSAGLFLYLGASDFLPSIKHNPQKPLSTMLPFLVGIILMIIALNIIPHSHEDEEGRAETQETSIEHQEE